MKTEKERITVEEVYSAARRKGISTMDGIDMIIFETTGDISIIEKITSRDETTFEDIEIGPDKSTAQTARAKR